MDEQKFEQFLADTESHPIEVICFAAKQLGWQIAIPNIDEDEFVPGMAIGTEEYLDELFGDLD